MEKGKGKSNKLHGDESVILKTATNNNNNNNKIINETDAFVSDKKQKEEGRWTFVGGKQNEKNRVGTRNNTAGSLVHHHCDVYS